MYELYEYALKLEPKPEKPEPTLAQMQMVNRARSFVTMKMRKRMNLREQKTQVKSINKLKKIIGSQLEDKIKEMQEE